MRILFLPRYGPLAGSSRYMTYDYVRYFESAGMFYAISPLQDDGYLLDMQARQRGEKGRGRLASALHRAASVVRRVSAVVSAWRYDVVVLEKDLVNSFPYVLEWLLFALNPHVVVQFDEATHVAYQERGWLIRLITRNKIRRIIQHAAHVVVWNEVMRDFSEALNPHVTVVSTGIDLERYIPKSEYGARDGVVRIGWIGSRGGFAYLHMLDDVMARLACEHNVELYVVSSEDYHASGVAVANRRWSLASEVEELTAMDIGVMPLPNNEWAAGKSGCKMLQYMAAGVPVVVSPVGINQEIVDDHTNGFLATTPQDWYDSLSKLIEDSAEGEEFGRSGRRYVEENNSQAEITRRLIEVVRSVAAGDGSVQP